MKKQYANVYGTRVQINCRLPGIYSKYRSESDDFDTGGRDGGKRPDGESYLLRITVNHRAE